jgi:hypothetical protein
MFCPAWPSLPRAQSQDFKTRRRGLTLDATALPFHTSACLTLWLRRFPIVRMFGYYTIFPLPNLFQSVPVQPRYFVVAANEPPPPPLNPSMTSSAPGLTPPYAPPEVLVEFRSPAGAGVRDGYGDTKDRHRECLVCVVVGARRHNVGYAGGRDSGSIA